MTFKIRNFTEKDLPVLVKLLNDAYRGTHEFTPYTEEDLLSWIRDGNLTILMAEENGEVIGSVSYRSGHWGEEIQWVVASQKPNRKLVEDALIREIEKYVKGETVFSAVDAGSPKINEWIERGYKPEGGLYHMIAKLDGKKPLPEVPEGIILRTLKPAEEKAFVEAVNAGFGWERIQQGTIERWKKEHKVFNEEWIQIAEYNNQIVSVVVAKPDTEYNNFFGAKRGYLGPAATLPEHRGKNLASALTRKAMNFLFEKEFDSVALYTAEQNLPSVTLLQKLGFQIEHHWKFMKKTLSKRNG
ncbi:MAG: GNAT family N-acetyltransferase [Candidatus Bathyarchaeota archaeon]|jgi:ribosomal protein S18 acetylase RimI-like enzyme|nr:GNAT family N-acetyltransferase [Candidatus Bathyarchaeota archaeon A05DMB-5]MDH7558382.1 GNAT family N-acetyltransferase [Candidatus Bathyarchaeota archaeon]